MSANEQVQDDPIEKLIENAKASARAATEAFHEWATRDAHVPDTVEHVLTGFRALLTLGAKNQETIASYDLAIGICEQLHQAAVREHERLTATGGDTAAVERRAAHIAERRQEVGVQKLRMQQQLLNLSQTLNILVVRYWALFPIHGQEETFRLWSN